MPVAGRKPKPEGQRRNNHKPTYDWVDVPNVPFEGGPKLPSRRVGGGGWPSRTKAWWAALSRMPHCALWGESEWAYAIDTAQIHAKFSDGDGDLIRAATELRNREKLLGNTMDSRRDLRIRYVAAPDQGEEAAGVTSIDDYRAALG